MAEIAVVSKVKAVESDWPYCGVKLTIHNIIVPEERLNPSPSVQDNMHPDLETELRMIGCELIQDSGILLRLPQVAMATAQVLYQRFFCSKSFVRHFYEHYAMACIFLAAKLEECPRRIRDVINVFHHIRQIREEQTPTPVMLDQSYSNMKNQVIKAERRILKELGFCVHAKHPHKLIIAYSKALEQQGNTEFVQTAWNYMNDSLRTDMFVRYLPEAIACACIHLASCKLGIPLPRHPAWWEMFTVDEDSIHEISLSLVRLYARPRPSITAIEAELAKLRDELMESKKRELELKKAMPSADAPSQGSDHGSVDISPKTVSEKVPLSSQDVKVSVDDSKLSGEACHIPKLPTNVLANAIATAKAVAANINATKTAARSGSEQPRNSTSPADDVSIETAKRSSRRSNSPSNNTKRPDEVSGRPAAYPNIAPVENNRISRKRRHEKLHSRSNKHHSNHRSLSRSPSTSTYSSEDGINQRSSGLPPIAYSNNSRHHNHIRSTVHRNPTRSTSDSETPPSSPHLHKRKKAIRHRNRSRSRSCSTSSMSSSSSVDDYRRPRRRRSSKAYSRGSPPIAYRVDRYAHVENSKRRSTTKLENGSRHRSKVAANDARRSILSSREHKRH